MLAGAMAGLAVLLLSVPWSVLAMKRPTVGAVLVVLLAAMLLDAGFAGLASRMGRPFVEPGWVDAYRRTGSSLTAMPAHVLGNLAILVVLALSS